MADTHQDNDDLNQQPEEEQDRVQTPDAAPGADPEEVSNYR